MEDVLTFLQQVIDALSPTAIASYWEAINQFFSDLILWCLTYGLLWAVALGALLSPSSSSGSGRKPGHCNHCSNLSPSPSAICQHCGAPTV